MMRGLQKKLFEKKKVCCFPFFFFLRVFSFEETLGVSWNKVTHEDEDAKSTQHNNSVNCVKTTQFVSGGSVVVVSSVGSVVGVLSCLASFLIEKSEKETMAKKKRGKNKLEESEKWNERDPFSACLGKSLGLDGA